MKDWKKELQEQIKNALKSGNKVRLNVLKMLKTDLTNEEIKNNREELTEEQVNAVIQRAVKKRKESIEEFKKAGKEDRVLEEENELKILMEFMPEQLTEEELKKVVDGVIEKVKAQSMKDMGKVMKEVMSMVKGKADGKIVNQIVRGKLSS